MRPRSHESRSLHAGTRKRAERARHKPSMTIACAPLSNSDLPYTLPHACATFGCVVLARCLGCLATQNVACDKHDLRATENALTPYAVLHDLRHVKFASARSPCTYTYIYTIKMFVWLINEASVSSAKESLCHCFI